MRPGKRVRWFRRLVRVRLGKILRHYGWWVFSASVAGLLARYVSLHAAFAFAVLYWLAGIRRPHFVDYGRFTAGVWPVTPTAPPLIFGLGWARHGEGPNAKIAGVEIILGRVVVGAFALVPRSEWPAYKRSQAAFDALQKESH